MEFTAQEMPCYFLSQAMFSNPSTLGNDCTQAHRQWLARRGIKVGKSCHWRKPIDVTCPNNVRFASALCLDPVQQCPNWAATSTLSQCSVIIDAFQNDPDPIFLPNTAAVPRTPDQSKTFKFFETSRLKTFPARQRDNWYIDNELQKIVSSNAGHLTMESRLDVRIKSQAGPWSVDILRDEWILHDLKTPSKQTKFGKLNWTSKLGLNYHNEGSYHIHEWLFCVIATKPLPRSKVSGLTF